MNSNSVENVRKLARKYRQENLWYCGGVVVIRDGVVQGWVNELRDPQHWQPGCIAVTEAGVCYISEGGNEKDGCKRWRLLAGVDLLPCPFCGSKNIRISERCYADDDGEHDGVECIDCDALNRLEHWNKRSGAGAPLPSSIQEALNSGDGVYRP